MNCKRFQRELPSYIYGELAGEERERFDRHAAACPACRRLLGETTETVSRLAAAGPVFSPGELAGFRNRVKEAVRSPGFAPRPLPPRAGLRIFSRPILLPAGAALAAAAILLIVFLPGRSAKIDRADFLKAAELVAYSEELEVEDRLVAEVWNEIEDIELLFSRDPESGSEAVGSRTEVRGAA